MKRPERDEEAHAAATEIAKTCNIGEQMVKDAIVKALTDMPKMLEHFDKKGKTAALRHHAIYLGIAVQLEKTVMPHAAEMRKDLTRITGDERHADVMADLYLAKVIEDTFKRVNEYELA